MTWLCLKSLSGHPNLDPIHKRANKGIFKLWHSYVMWGLVSKLMMTAFSQRLQFPSYPTQELLFQQFGPKQINPSQPRGTPWSLPYSWQSEVLDLAQMVMTIRKQHKMTSFIIPNNYCFN